MFTHILLLAQKSKRLDAILLPILSLIHLFFLFAIRKMYIWLMEMLLETKKTKGYFCLLYLF